MVEDRQRLCKLAFERMADPVTLLYGSGIGSHYQGQQSTLSKYFARKPKDEGQLTIF